MDQRTMIFPRSYDKWYVEHNIIVLISYQSYSLQLNWMKGKERIPEVIPIKGMCPQQGQPTTSEILDPPCSIIIMMMMMTMIIKFYFRGTMKYAAIPLHLKGNMLLNIICMEQGPWHSICDECCMSEWVLS